MDISLVDNSTLLCLTLNYSECGNMSDTEIPSLARSILLGTLFGLVDIGAIIGNILVILSVVINHRLRTVTNCFVVSLATADLLVGILVLPLGIKVEITGTWELGIILCDMWISFDVMLCTASILNLCCISLDRYFAITNPLVYVTKRSKRLALVMICIVWAASAVITCPPIFGWREEGRGENDSNCYLTKDPGYIIYSSLGSFYIPLLIMIFVYGHIFKVAREREKRLRPYRRSFIKGNTKLGTEVKYTRKMIRDNSSSMLDTLGSDGKDEEDVEERLIETTLAAEDRDAAIRAGKCVSVRQLHEGLVISSAMAMTDMVNVHKHNNNSHHGDCRHDNDSYCQYKKRNSSIRSNHSYRSSMHGRNSVHNSQHSSRRSSQRSSLRNSIQSNHHHGNSNHGNHHHHSNNHSHSTSPQLYHVVRPTSPSLRHSSSMRNNHTTSSSRSSDFFSKRDERRRERMVLMRERKTAKTLAVVVGCFVVCWLPFFLMYVIEPFCSTCSFDPILRTVITWLGYCNSVINPFIYAFYNRDFRSSFWKLTCGLLLRRKRKRPEMKAIYLAKL